MTSSVSPPPATENQLPIVFQYTVDAYKTFQKLAENLPNPIAAAMFSNFAEDERRHRDLLEIKYASASTPRMKITLVGDLRFQDVLEGDLSYRELTETLISRERTMEKTLMDAMRSGPESERHLYRYLAAGKRAHVAHLERELEMIHTYPDWYKREDAESVIVHGRPVA